MLDCSSVFLVRFSDNLREMLMNLVDIDLLEEEVKLLADERTAELLPLLFERLLDRKGLIACPRHGKLYARRVAEISLHHAKRNYHIGFLSEESLEKVKLHTLQVRKEYRSLPCECWITKR